MVNFDSLCKYKHLNKNKIKLVFKIIMNDHSILEQLHRFRCKQSWTGDCGKFTKLSRIGFSTECFTAGFSGFYGPNFKSKFLGNFTFLKCLNFLRPKSQVLQQLRRQHSVSVESRSVSLMV